RGRRRCSRGGAMPVGGGGVSLGGGREDVGPRDPPVATRADDGVLGEAVLVEESPHDRRLRRGRAGGRAGVDAAGADADAAEPATAGSSARATAASTLAGSASSASNGSSAV